MQLMVTVSLLQILGPKVFRYSQRMGNSFRRLVPKGLVMEILMDLGVLLLTRSILLLLIVITLGFRSLRGMDNLFVNLAQKELVMVC
uniref:Uncharacterized protein n=1 Tax=Arcella intermedia TaxID=1963864 RepID=A0A6B2LT15_9EUKA